MGTGYRVLGLRGVHGFRRKLSLCFRDGVAGIVLGIVFFVGAIVGEPPREVASSVEFAGTPAAMRGDWQEFRSGAEVPSLSLTACSRRIQRELPSTLTNGQKVGRMFQRKMFHAFFSFFDLQ